MFPGLMIFCAADAVFLIGLGADTGFLELWGASGTPQRWRRLASGDAPLQ
jgi:hypothetical protein